MVDNNIALTGGEIDTLVALVERGPLEDGEIPCKAGRAGLLKLGFCVQIIRDRETGHYASTMDGYQWYLNRYEAEDIVTARKNRIAKAQQ